MGGFWKDVSTIKVEVSEKTEKMNTHKQENIDMDMKTRFVII